MRSCQLRSHAEPTFDEERVEVERAHMLERLRDSVGARRTRAVDGVEHETRGCPSSTSEVSGDASEVDRVDCAGLCHPCVHDRKCVVVENFRLLK